MNTNKQRKDSRINASTVKNIKIPTHILCDRSAAVLESVTEYLKVEKNLTYHEIAQLLNRDDRTIWTAYNRTIQKREKTSFPTSKLKIPSKIIRDRKLAILESIVEYLKEKKTMSYHEIAVALNRDDRTIWTVYNRAKKKRGQK